MTRWLLLVSFAAASGCYLDLRGGPVAPTKQGNGSWTGHFVATSGGERSAKWGHVGGGVSMYGALGSDDGGLPWIAGGPHVRAEIALMRLWYSLDANGGGTPPAFTYQKSIVSLTTLSFGLGGSPGDEAQRVSYFDAFSGVGMSNRDAGRARWFTWAIGATANRLFPELSDGAWFVGVALCGGFGYSLSEPPPP
ncbi:MAG TPA: hypothetical protein VIV11_40080 [Kofleriaceae bacterium]